MYTAAGILALLTTLFTKMTWHARSIPVAYAISQWLLSYRCPCLDAPNTEKPMELVATCNVCEHSQKPMLMLLSAFAERICMLQMVPSLVPHCMVLPLVVLETVVNCWYYCCRGWAALQGTWALCQQMWCTPNARQTSIMSRDRAILLLQLTHVHAMSGMSWPSA